MCYDPVIKTKENNSIYTEPIHGNEAFKRRCMTYKQEFNFALKIEHKKSI